MNPRADSIDGLPCYPDIDSLQEVPDVAVVLLGADKAHHAVKALSERGCAIVNEMTHRPSPHARAAQRIRLSSV